MQASFHHAMDGGRFGGCMRPGTMEAYCDGAGGAGVGIATSQIAFLGDDGVQVTWDVNGAGMFDSVPLVIPGRQDFYQGAIYRLKLTNLPGRAGVTLYPTLEVAPVTPRTDAYLAHSPIPVQFTEEDFDQVTSGNFVTKVIYLPDPEFQELALAGVETLVSTRLDPGVDPIAEADRRGSILAIVRIGNKDIELGSGASRPQTRSVVPAFQQGSQNGRAGAGSATQTSFQPRGDGAQAQYCEQGCPCDGGQMCEGGPNCEGGPMCQCGPMCRGGSMYQGGPMYDGGGNMGCGPGGGSMPNMPVGMPTGFNGPPAVPPNMIAGAPQWGMPITGTPIGLPGPPHVPLGIPAGLQQHVMKNKTRVMIPPPVTKMVERVKQRPGLNYPRPDDHVCVDETQREPIRLFPAWLNPFHHHGGAGGGAGGGGGADCGPCPQ
jgi:hypothetical protein